MGLHDLFKESVNRNPKATAVVLEEDTLTYGELDRLSDHYARKLVERGVGKDVLVGMCFDRNFEMIVAMLSIAKAGGVYVPIDPAYPQGRRDYITSDSGMKHLLIEEATAKLFESSDLNTFLVDAKLSLDGTNHDLPLRKVEHNGAYVIYTSGTSGDPKGVLVDHANVLRLFKQSDELFDFDNTDRWSFFHSICFDFSVWEIWGALIHGAQLVIVPYSVSRSSVRFYELVTQKGITVMNQTPSAFRNFIAENKVSLSGKLSLRYIIFGGEKLEYNLVSEWTSLNGTKAPELVNMYGITETTVHVTFHKITSQELKESTTISIGNPIPDLDVYLLDEEGKEVPQGDAGEMFIAGPGLAREYLNKPDLTAKKFVERRVNGRSIRMYRSGDMAKRDASGLLHFVGRIDDQIKLNGFRIEPKELESIAKEINSVADATVLKVDVAEQDQRLINFVLVAGEMSDSQQIALRETLIATYKKRVPNHMRPYENVLLSEYPKTSNGKLDRKRMVEEYLYVDNQVKEDSLIGGENILEDSERLWKEILEIPEVDEMTDFFDLGGTSLSLIQLLNDTKKIFGVSLNMGRFHEGFFLTTYVSELYRERASGIWRNLIDDFNEERDHDIDFFDLGGTSLSLIQLINETKDLISIQLNMSNFHEGISYRTYINEIEKSIKSKTTITK